MFDFPLRFPAYDGGARASVSMRDLGSQSVPANLALSIDTAKLDKCPTNHSDLKINSV